MTSGCRLESTLEGRLADGRQVEKASAKRAFEWKKTATRRTGPARQLRFRSSHRPLNNPGQPIEPDQAFHRRLSCPPKVPMDDDRLAHEPRLANLAIFAPANGVGRTSSELPCRLCTPNDGGRLPNLSAERHLRVRPVGTRRRSRRTRRSGVIRVTPDPSIWRARGPNSIYGQTARMERSEPLARASRRPCTVPDIDPQAGDMGHPPPRRTGVVSNFF